MATKWTEVILGIGLLSPLDETIVGLATGGLSAPSAPIQGIVSGIAGVAIIAHGFGVWK